MKWLINILLLLAGATCLSTQLDVGWEDRLMYAPGIAVVLFFAFLVVKIIPLLDANWAMFVLAILSLGISLSLPIGQGLFVLIAAGLILTLADAGYRVFKLSPDVEKEFEGWFGDGAHIELLFGWLKIPGWLCGIVASGLGIYFLQQ